MTHPRLVHQPGPTEAAPLDRRCAPIRLLPARAGDWEHDRPVTPVYILPARSPSVVEPSEVRSVRCRQDDGRLVPFRAPDPLPPVPVRLTESRRRPAILVVEDDDSIAELLDEFFVLEGFAVEIERSGRSVVSHLGAGQVDLILLDLRLPDLSGFAVCRQVRAWEAERAIVSRTPIIILSATVSGDIAARCGQAGADAYVAKPFDVDALLTTVHQWTEGARDTDISGGRIRAGAAASPEFRKECDPCR